jgi:hypothetical protein
MLVVSCCLSATGIRFLGVLFPPRNPALLTVGLPVTPRRRHRTLTGFPRSTRMSYGRVGCPLYPGGDGIPTTIGTSAVAACRHCNGRPLPPRYYLPTRDVRMTRHQQGFRFIHPSGLPLTCDTRSDGHPWAFP